MEGGRSKEAGWDPAYPVHRMSKKKASDLPNGMRRLRGRTSYSYFLMPVASPPHDAPPRLREVL